MLFIIGLLEQKFVCSGKICVSVVVCECVSVKSARRGEEGMGEKKLVMSNATSTVVEALCAGVCPRWRLLR